MNIFRINTTAYEEEDFFLLTDLSEEQINDVLAPLIEREREGLDFYSNEELRDELVLEYPNAVVNFQTEIETITI
jgi:hypothetical protein